MTQEEYSALVNKAKLWLKHTTEGVAEENTQAELAEAWNIIRDLLVLIGDPPKTTFVFDPVHYPIEKGLPIKSGNNVYRRKSYPFERMDVGDSILVGTGNQTSAKVSASRIKGKKFTSRMTDDGLRIWRVE